MSPESPFFSVILPVYNGEKYIGKAIESVLRQSESDWELVIIDDCSHDGTPAILESYAARFPQVKVLRNPVNLNIARSLNRGISEAKGEWMVRLDGDDFFKEDYLHVLRFAIENKQRNRRCFFSSWVTIVDEAGESVLDVRLPDAKTVQRMMPVENFLYHPATCFSKYAWDLVAGYPVEDRRTAEDTALWLKFFKFGIQLVMIPQCLVHYRVHYSNITSVNDAKLFRTAAKKESKAVRQYWEWRISLFLKQSRLKNARSELLKLSSLEGRLTLKNLNYYVLTFMPEKAVRYFMWYVRPWLRSRLKDLAGRHTRV